jgi:uncharacterized membrane protein YfcA
VEGVFSYLFLIFIGQFVTKEAIPLSNTLIVGASIANFIQFFNRYHPHIKRSLIYYDLAILMEPATLSGTMIGVLLYSMFPDWLILGLLIIILILTIILTTIKGINLYLLETDQKNKTIQIEEKNIQIINYPHHWNIKYKKVIVQLLFLFFILLIITIVSLAKGNTTGQSIFNILSCSLDWWLLIFIPFGFLLLISGGVMIYFLWFKENKLPEQGDIHWTFKNTILIIILSVCAGTMTSLVGIGGGIILGPLMLFLNLLPEVVVATASFMVMFTSISAVIQYSVIGVINWSYGVIFMIIGFISSFGGQLILSYFIKKFNKKSIIIFLIDSVITISAILLITLGSINVAQDIKYHVNLDFINLCK